MRVRTRVVALLAATGITAAVVLVGTTMQPSPDPAPEPEAAAPTSLPTTLAAYDPNAEAVARAPFCERVSPTGIEHALGDVPADSEEWANGDRERLPDGSRDRVHEFGCRWTAVDGTQASGWVFAPPVTRPQARELTAEVPAGPCQTVRDAGSLGRPGAAERCDLDTGIAQVRFAGLIGDAWLTCTLSAPGDPLDLDARAGEWCVQVIEAARG